MKSKMQEFCLRASIPCGFSDSEGEISTNAAMMELLAFNKDAPEMEDLLAKISTEKSLFYVISNLTFDYKKPPKLWQIDFIPLLSQENSYLGTFFFTLKSSCFCHRWSMSMASSLMQLAQKDPTSCSLIKSGKYCFSRCNG
ncbi:hypothetical protein [Arsenophonus endosymbiont of Aleurodicus floccissimus]|uniref:hypothetical protein n=1 Tax=Arsenophonus endosymbiont of Aleurodicus floccissimus TaxID=2152761 RepID=UPI000E6B4B1E|nr:hypothetical protein [Arsenophonus endosymbiont of Aleurodicus floccissimus]